MEGDSGAHVIVCSPVVAVIWLESAWDNLSGCFKGFRVHFYQFSFRNIFQCVFFAVELRKTANQLATALSVFRRIDERPWAAASLAPHKTLFLASGCYVALRLLFSFALFCIQESLAFSSLLNLGVLLVLALRVMPLR